MIMYDKNMIIYVYVKGLRKYVEGVCSDWIENNGTLNSQRGNKPKTQNSKPILSPLKRDSADIFLPALQCHLLCMRQHCGPGMG